MKEMKMIVVVFLAACLTPGVEAAKKPKLDGMLAISSGDEVVLLDPDTGGVRRVETGPVGFLFPGPGGVLFAPDLVNSNTTVIDARFGRVADFLSGVTLPRFGPWNDRYLIVSGALTIVTYPERSLVTRMDGEFNRPWQVEIGPVGINFLILERDPGGKAGSILSAVDLGSRKVVARREFEEDLHRFAVVSGIGLLAVADATNQNIRLLDPATFLDVEVIEVEGGAADLAAIPDKKDLFAVGRTGTMFHWRLKNSQDGLTVKAEDSIDIPGPGARMVMSPAGDSVAVVTDAGTVVVVDPKRGETLGSWETGTVPRDLVWFDLNRPGPVAPSWSDRGLGPEGVELQGDAKK